MTHINIGGSVYETNFRQWNNSVKQQLHKKIQLELFKVFRNVFYMNIKWKVFRFQTVLPVETGGNALGHTFQLNLDHLMQFKRLFQRAVTRSYSERSFQGWKFTAQDK